MTITIKTCYCRVTAALHRIPINKTYTVIIVFLNYTVYSTLAIAPTASSLTVDASAATDVIYSTVQYSTVQYSTVQYCTVLYCTVLYCTVL